MQDGCRTEIWPDLRCESKARLGGEETGTCEAPEQILPACHGVHTGNAEENFSGTPVFPEKYGEYDDGPACPCSCRTAEKFCRSTQTRAPAENVASEFSTFPMEGMTDARIAFMLLWAKRNGFFRAVPHRGERPSPHQETEADTSARNTTRSYSNIVQDNLRKFCRLTPPAEAGSSHRQTAGGGGQNLVLNGRCELSEIFKKRMHVTAPFRHNARFRFGRFRELPPVRRRRPPLKIKLMKTNFNVNLIFLFFFSFLKSFFNDYSKS